jgi:hypothetical protein
VRQNRHVLIDDTLAFLLGEWTLSRSLQDHRSGALGTFRGSATLNRTERKDAHAEYAESGELHWGSHAGPAFRKLVFEPLPDGSVLLRFADGRRYVPLDLRAGAWNAAHDCGADRYEIETVARAASVVEERWRVRGPAKDYTAVTRLTRVG